MRVKTTRPAKNQAKPPIGAIVYVTLDGAHHPYAKNEVVSIYATEEVLFLCDVGTLTINFKRESPFQKGRVLWGDRSVPVRSGPVHKRLTSSGQKTAKYRFGLTVTTPDGKEHPVDPVLVVEVMAPGLRQTGRPDGGDCKVSTYTWSAAPPPGGHI